MEEKKYHIEESEIVGEGLRAIASLSFYGIISIIRIMG